MPHSAHPHEKAAGRSRLHGRRRLAWRLGIDADTRKAVVAELFNRSPDGIAAYWLQLSLSIGIATLGLVMGSGAVIIGAMLVAPLMSPIVELALSLLVGAGSVMIGASARVVLSVGVSVGAAALLTALLPFNEPSAEILARVSPTVLDLFVAMCCAVAAAFVTAHPSGNASSTAAGTAIGISLVPPLCTVGFGLGTGSAAIAEGALLLFVANFTAILACSTLFFWLVGFRPLPSAAFDARRPAHYGFGPLLGRLGRRLDQGIASRFHLVWRLAVPIVLVLAVSIPLESAYQRMVWQVRTRTSLARIVRETPLLAGAVSVSSVVESSRVAFRAVVVGEAADAQSLEETLRARIASETGVSPLVEVTAVPAASAAAAPPSLVPPDVAAMTPAAPAADATLAATEEAIAHTVQSAWPEAAGMLVSHAVTLEHGRVGLRVVALGRGLEPTAVEMLDRILEALLARDVVVDAVAVPDDALTAPPGRGAAWLKDAEPRAALADLAPELLLCVGVPARATREPTVAAAVDEWTRRHAPDRVVRVAGAPEWSLRVAVGLCD
jgi:uncharacterized hydrophobic protein (TIGR00271 family)